MTIRTYVVITCLLVPALAWAQQANVNLDYNPQKNSEKSIAKFLNDPNANRKIDYLFVGQGTEEAKGQMGARCVALHQALLNHKITHEYYVAGYGGHDWATWRHLLYYRLLPNLWRKN